MSRIVGHAAAIAIVALSVAAEVVWGTPWGVTR